MYNVSVGASRMFVTHRTAIIGIKLLCINVTSFSFVFGLLGFNI